MSSRDVKLKGGESSLRFGQSENFVIEEFKKKKRSSGKIVKKTI